jgi:hypothetical protein
VQIVDFLIFLKDKPGNGFFDQFAPRRTQKGGGFEVGLFGVASENGKNRTLSPDQRSELTLCNLPALLPT